MKQPIVNTGFQASAAKPITQPHALELHDATKPATAAPAPASPAPAASNPLQALKGVLPWKQLMQGGIPMVAGTLGLLNGQNNLAPLMEGNPGGITKASAYDFGRHIARKCHASRQR